MNDGKIAIPLLKAVSEILEKDKPKFWLSILLKISIMKLTQLTRYYELDLKVLSGDR
ncbi:hypothetical protein AusDCA_3887 [Desulfitobacterium sp. AusDCA]